MTKSTTMATFNDKVRVLRERHEALPLELPLDVTSTHYDAPAIKHIISGQLIIRRAGNSFTVLGTAIQ